MHTYPYSNRSRAPETRGNTALECAAEFTYGYAESRKKAGENPERRFSRRQFSHVRARDREKEREMPQTTLVRPSGNHIDPRVDGKISAASGHRARARFRLRQHRGRWRDVADRRAGARQESENDSYEGACQQLPHTVNTFAVRPASWIRRNISAVPVRHPSVQGPRGSTVPHRKNFRAVGRFPIESATIFRERPVTAPVRAERVAVRFCRRVLAPASRAGKFRPGDRPGGRPVSRRPVSW